MDFQRREPISRAVSIEVIGTLLGFRLGRDDQRVNILTGCSGFVRILQLDDLIGGRVSIAHVIEFSSKTLAPFLERTEQVGVSRITPRLRCEGG